MAILGFELEEIARLLALIEAQQWEELIIEEEGRYLRIRGPRPESPARPAQEAATSGVSYPRAMPTTRPAGRKQLPPKPKVPKLGGLAPDEIALTAPMVGVFYRAGSPGTPPLIKVGDQIAFGQTIGIIEAMKIFSEIPADHAGVVAAIPAQDGQLVRTGEPLVILKQSA